MKDKLLYTTAELFKDYLGGRKFSIPAYQRGYKWESKDVERLLDDINEFSPNDELDLFYCLQNITLVEEDITPRNFNVVDGQQRLTTLTIILSYLGEYDLVRDKLEYKVRKETETFLENYILKESEIGDIAEWEDLLERTKAEMDYDFQDIYYIFNAYKTIQRWFAGHPSAKREMKNKILHHLKVIVNLPKNIQEQELFENLNGKRVPLDGADLIRALIITRVAKREVGELDDTIKQNVLINERRIRIGLVLDAINLWWSDTNKQKYFSQFTKEAKVSDSSSVSFDSIKYPINNLYKLYVLVFCNGKLDMEVFERKSVEDDFIQELQTLQRILENWYNDRVLYHLILFTSIYAGKNKNDKLTFKDMYLLWTQNMKRGFVDSLKDKIAETPVFDELIKQESYLDEKNEEMAFKENWYDDSQLVCVSVLLDIINILTKNDNTKLPVEFFKRQDEDLEHIFPQTPIGDKIKDQGKQTIVLRQYLEIINKYMPDQGKITITDEEIDWDNPQWKEDVKTRIKDAIGKVIPINSLGNMCVLNLSVNRGYGNDFFLEKRIDIMRKSQEGKFIRPHVYDAFNKIYLKRQAESIDMSMMSKWEKQDILKRRKYIINRIGKFLGQNETK